MGPLRDITIYYFTGTGNSRQTAFWFKEVALGKGISTNLIDIGELKTRRNLPYAISDMIGIISPIHGFNFPPVMLHFIFRLPRGGGRKVFIMNTRAGMKAGKIFLPGLSGMAQYLTAIVLLIKGYRVIGMRGVDLPSNWLSLHPGIRQKVVNNLFDHVEPKVKQFATTILPGKSDLSALREIVQDLLITPVAIMYYLVGRFFLAKSFIASHGCNACQKCAKECPVEAIRMINNRPYWTFNCESCMHCMNSCPKRAIETTHLYLAILILSANLILASNVFWLTDLLEKISSALPLSAYVLKLTFFTMLLIALQFLSYRILHFLLRYSFIENILVYGSLTHYKFWRRYKGRSQ